MQLIASKLYHVDIVLVQIFAEIFNFFYLTFLILTWVHFFEESSESSFLVFLVFQVSHGGASRCQTVRGRLLVINDDSTVFDCMMCWFSLAISEPDRDMLLDSFRQSAGVQPM